MLHGKNAVVTGARRGIGRATIEVFASHGANIWACAREKDENFEADMESVAKKYNVAIWPLYFDITDEKQIKKAAMSIKKSELDVDILANIAGEVGPKTSFIMTDIPDFRHVMETNYISVTTVTQYIARLMIRQKKGSIVFVSSIAGLDGIPSQYPYAASKAALIGATKNLARELADNNIRVNAVAPGMIETDMIKNIEEDLKYDMLTRMMMKRMGKPEEIANVIAFLGSDMSSYITGQIIRADGGI